MAPLPIRGLGEVGVITDVSPFDLPLNGYSFAANARFKDGQVVRGPVFKAPGAVANSPRLLWPFVDSTGAAQAMLMGSNGKITQWTTSSSGISETDLSPVGFTPAVLEAPLTETEVNNLIYINRPDHIPWFYNKSSSTKFAAIASGTAQWPTDYRCKALRATNGLLMAINLQKGALAAPTTVMWSGFTQFNSQPLDWDFENPTSNSGQNTLSELAEPLIDGGPLNNVMYLYSENETWSAQFTGDSNMFFFDRKWQGRGIINVNCAVEADGRMFVFGSDDLWAHDGVRQDTLASGKVKKFVFKSLVQTAKDQCFVVSNRKDDEVWFCYQSVDDYVRFPVITGTIGCNRAAVLNYRTGVWTFWDLPYVTSAAFNRQTLGVSWDSSDGSWGSLGGTWGGAQDSNVTSLFVGLADTRLAVFSAPDDAGDITTIDTTLTSPVALYRIGIDLDEAKADLRGWKLVSSIYPECQMDGTIPLVFQIGASDHPSQPIVWGVEQTFDPDNYKLDHNIGGRYLHIKMTSDIISSFSLVGYDMDVMVLGER